MKRKNLLALALFFCCMSGTVAAQNNLSHLKSWAGKYPTSKTGRVTTRFFGLPEIRRPLLKLLSRTDYNLLTRDYRVEVPIKLIGDYLAVKDCRPHACDTDNAGFVIDLRDGAIHVKMYAATNTRWFSSKGKYTDLPEAVLAYINDFSANQHPAKKLTSAF
jgi:hypothetical protein